MHIAKPQEQAREVKSFSDALLRLGCVTRRMGAMPLRRNKIGKMWLMYVLYKEGFTFLSKPMWENHPTHMVELQ